MKVYLFADIEVRDEKTYFEYVRQAREIMKKYGGRHLVKNEVIMPLSGGWEPRRVILLEFPSREALRECFDSPEYRRIAPLRESSISSRAIIMEEREAEK